MLPAWACAGATDITPPASQGLQPQAEPIALVRSSLRAVATAQEAHWEEHGTYTTDLAVLRSYPACRIQENVTVHIADASATGFATEAMHRGFSGTELRAVVR